MAFTRNFAQAKKHLGWRLGTDKSFSSQNYTRFPEDLREYCINEARRELARRRDLRFFEATHQLTMTIGDMGDTGTYLLPSAWCRPYFAFYLASGKKTSLYPRTRVEFDDLYVGWSTSNANQAPEHMCVYGSNILIGPPPDSAYSAYIRYFKYLSDLTGSSTEFPLLEACWDTVMALACRRAGIELMEPALEDKWGAIAEREIGKVSREHARARWSDRRPQSSIMGA